MLVPPPNKVASSINATIFTPSPQANRPSSCIGARGAFTATSAVAAVGGVAEPLFSLSLPSPVNFDDCAGNEAVVLRSSDPLFGVRRDGSIFAAEEASLDEPVRFKVTAEGPRAPAWETVVQLAPADPPPVPQEEKEVSYVAHARAR